MGRTRVLMAGMALAALAAVLVATPALAHGGLWGGFGERDERLADALGVTVEDLQAARDAAMQAALEDAVEAGRIDPERAELVLARRQVHRAIDRKAILATVLGITESELEAAIEEGSLRDVMVEEDVGRAELAAAMRAAHGEAVDAAVAAGTITAEQGAALKSRDFAFKRGRPGGFRFHRWAPAPEEGGATLLSGSA